MRARPSPRALRGLLPRSMRKLRTPAVLCCPTASLLPARPLPGRSGIFSGLVYDALEKHKKFGPRVVLALGLLTNAGGYLGLWAAVTG